MKSYYGEETIKALKNFPFSVPKVDREFILSIIKVKKACALANYTAHNLNLEVKNAIVKACDEILKGGYESEFPLSSFQGGAGTAINMNVNEVLASKATQILNNKIKVHPNDDVNGSQSTNDVNPSALKISIFYLLENLKKELSSLIVSFQKKSKEFRDIKKLGRTHLQDAIPTTLGKEFEVYAEVLKKYNFQIKMAQDLSKILNLGGTAIGNSLNANPVYIKEVYKELNKITGGKFYRAKNLMARTSSQTDFLIISQVVVSLSVDLSKIANDFKFMASGPNGGIGEIILPELQKGSSIMPGKVNPVMPETINQLYYLVSGNNISIEKATEASELELGVMLPIIIDKLIESIRLTTEVIGQFNNLCVKGVKANKERCAYHLEKSTAYATILVPYLGYDIVSKIVKKSISEGKTLREIVVGESYLTENDFNKIINSYKFLR